MASNQGTTKHLFKIHLAGGLVCVLIAGSSVYFAGSSISKRRGLFFTARQELSNAKAQLNESAKQRTTLASRVQVLEQESANLFDLVPIKQLNERTAQIVALAEQVEIRVDSLQPLDRITDKRVPVEPLELIASADADNVFGFLRSLHDRMPDIHIQTIDLLSDSIESPIVQIRMLMYWFTDPADENS